MQTDGAQEAQHGRRCTKDDIVDAAASATVDKGVPVRACSISGGVDTTASLLLDNECHRSRVNHAQSVDQTEYARGEAMMEVV